MNTFDKLRDLLVNKFCVPQEIIKPDSTMESLGLDSLEILDLLGFLEDEFGIIVDDDQFDSIKCLNDLIKLIERL
ncbi:MAG: acyl carrier protein [Oscillospiraceae bacterium]|nr:acyl carrier protein [Oscillospiraceae bacterium]